MRRSISIALLVLPLVAHPALGQAAHSGSWRAVVSKSRWSTGPLPTGFSLTIDLRFSENQLVYHSTNDTDKNALGGLAFTAPLDGTPERIEHNRRFDRISVRRLGPDDFEILEMKGNDVIVGSFWTFSPDGHSFVRRGVGKAADGTSKAFEEFFERK